MIADAGDQRACLQPGDEKHHAFDEVNEEIPEEDALEARRGADQPEAVPTDVEPGGHGGEHAGAAQMFGRPIGKERRQNRERDLDARIMNPAPQTQHQPTDSDSPEDFASDDRREHSCSLAERKYASAHCG